MQIYTKQIHDNNHENLHCAAWKLLEQAIQETYHIPLPKVATDEHGKPYFPQRQDIHFNITHCTGLVTCVLDSHPVGIDAEIIRPLREGVLRRSFSESEAKNVHNSTNPDKTFFQYWTLKEAFVKAIGIGISYPLNKVNFAWNDDKIISNQDNWQFHQKIIDDLWIISVANYSNDEFYIE